MGQARKTCLTVSSFHSSEDRETDRQTDGRKPTRTCKVHITSGGWECDGNERQLEAKGAQMGVEVAEAVALGG